MFDFRNYLTPQQQQQQGGFFTTLFGQPQPNPPLKPEERRAAHALDDLNRKLEGQRPVKTPEQLRLEQLQMGPPAHLQRFPDLAPTIAPGRRVPEMTTPLPPSVPPDERTPPPAAAPAEAAPTATGDPVVDKLRAMIGNPNFTSMIGTLAKSMGGGTKAPLGSPAPLTHAQPGRPGFHEPEGWAQGMIKQLQETAAQRNAGWKKKRQARTDDPHAQEQEMYDFRRLRGRG